MQLKIMRVFILRDKTGARFFIILLFCIQFVRNKYPFDHFLSHPASPCVSHCNRKEIEWSDTDIFVSFILSVSPNRALSAPALEVGLPSWINIYHHPASLGIMICLSFWFWQCTNFLVSRMMYNYLNLSMSLELDTSLQTARLDTLYKLYFNL